MRRAHEAYELDDDRSRLDVTTIHAWLTMTYWSPGVARDTVERAIIGSSLVVGAYLGVQQVGITRIVSDKASFAWVCDVFVDEAHRGRGIGRAMIRFALNDPAHQGLRRWCLGTKDAHGVYAALGFKPLPEPQRWMILKPGQT